MIAIGLTGMQPDTQCLVAAQLLQRVTEKGKPISVCLGIVAAEHAGVIYAGGGELWRIGQDPSRPELDPHVDRVIDTSCDEATLIDRVDHALGLFLGKLPVGVL